MFPIMHIHHAINRIKQQSQAMQHPIISQLASLNKRITSSPSVSIPFRPVVDPTKAGRIRRTDHTEDKHSEASLSRAMHNHQQHHNNGLETPMEREGNQSSRLNIGGDGVLRLLGEREEKVVELRERLKNIHHFYRIRIEEERSRNLERNEIFIGIIEELQKTHNERIIAMQKSLQEVEDDKREIGTVDERMGNIRVAIEDVLKQSQELKETNEGLERDITKRSQAVKHKEAQLERLRDELYSMKEKVEHFERLKLKQNKRNKELLQMIQNIF